MVRVGNIIGKEGGRVLGAEGFADVGGEHAEECCLGCCGEWDGGTLGLGCGGGEGIQPGAGEREGFVVEEVCCDLVLEGGGHCAGGCGGCGGCLSTPIFRNYAGGGHKLGFV